MDRIRVHLDVDLASQPIEGEVAAPGRPAHAFVGWLGLTSALEHAIADGAAGTPRLPADAPAAPALD